jgi:hypothetical protein
VIFINILACNGMKTSLNSGADGRIVKILRWNFKGSSGRVWSGLLWLKIGTNGAACKQGNEPSWVHKGRVFLAAARLLASL